MNCPVCNNVLVAVEQDGFALEMCPVCKGGWLDRKDLARLLGRMSGATESVQPDASAPVYAAVPPPPPPQQQYQQPQQQYQQPPQQQYQQQPQQRGGIAGLFDAFSERNDSHHDDHGKHGHDDHDKHGYGGHDSHHGERDEHGNYRKRSVTSRLFDIFD